MKRSLIIIKMKKYNYKSISIITVLLTIYLIATTNSQITSPLPPHLSITTTTTTTTTSPPSLNQQQQLTPNDFNNLPGNPDPAQVKILAATTIKHNGIHKPTETPVGGSSNKTSKSDESLGNKNIFNEALFIGCFIALVFVMIM